MKVYLLHMSLATTIELQCWEIRTSCMNVRKLLTRIINLNVFDEEIDTAGNARDRIKDSVSTLDAISERI